MSHYGIEVGMVIEERAFGSTFGPGEVIYCYAMDNNRVRVRLMDGSEEDMIPEYCREIAPKPDVKSGS